MSFLKRWGKKRNEEGSSVANKTITKVDITAISNPSTFKDGNEKFTTSSPVDGPVQNSNTAWPLQEQDDASGAKYWDDQRPLTMIPESPELTASPRIQTSTTNQARLDFATKGSRTSDSRTPWNAPSGPRASPYPNQQFRAPHQVLQTQQASSTQGPRVRLPKIPPPDSDNWNPLSGHIAAQYSRSGHYQHHPHHPHGLPSPPPTASTVGTHQSGSSMYDAGCSPNWISFSYPSKHQSQNYTRPKDMSVGNVSSSRTLLASPEITPIATPTPRVAHSYARKQARAPDTKKSFARTQGMDDPFQPTGHAKGPSTPPRRPATPTRQIQPLSRRPSTNKQKLTSPLRHAPRHARNVSSDSRQRPSIKRLSTHMEKRVSPVKRTSQQQAVGPKGKLVLSPIRTVLSPMRHPSPRRYVQESPRGRARHSRQGSSLSRNSRPRSRSSLISTRSRVMERNVRRAKTTERKQKKMTQLDEQINLIATRLQKLEALSEQLRTLPSVPEIDVEDGPSDRNDSVVDSELDAKTIISDDGSDWETLEEISEPTTSSRQGRRSRFKMHTPGESVAQSVGQSSAGHIYYTSAWESINSDPTGTTSRGSPAKKRCSVLETGLATRVACTRQAAPAMVQLRNSNSNSSSNSNSNTSPRKTPRSHRISRLGHRPQPSAYSFITFKSLGGSTANLHAHSHSNHDWFDHSRSDDEDLDADNDDFEDVLDEIDEEPSSHNIDLYRPGTSGALSSTSNLSIFPYQQKFRGPGSSTVSLRSGLSSSRGGPGATYPYWSPEDLETITRTATPASSARRGTSSQDTLRSPVRRPSQRQVQQHIRNASRTLVVDENGKATAAVPGGRSSGNGRFAVADMKRWMQRVPRKVVHVRAPSRGEKPGSGCTFTGGRS